jgi:CelD/BcsL family acetyltransferase involved in cellulose biosynthesis
MRKHGIASRVIAPHDLSPAEIAFWDELSSSVTAVSSPFLSHHFVRAVAESGMNVRVCVIYEGDAIRAFFPYQYRSPISGWLKASEPAGGEMADYFGLIAEPGFSITPKELLRLAGTSCLNFSHLDEIQLKYGLTGEQPRVGLRIRLNSPSSEAGDAMSPARRKYVKDTERRERQLAKEVGETSFNFDVQHDRPAVLDHLIRQKRAQYARTGKPDALKEAWKIRLLHKLADYRFDGCRAVLSTISAGDKWIAGHFGIAGNGVLQYWFPVYAPEFARYAPGRLLIHRIAQNCPSAGIHTIDRGEGDNPSKREVANDEHLYYRGVWADESLRSWMAHGVQRIKWRLGI